MTRAASNWLLPFCLHLLLLCLLALMLYPVLWMLASSFRHGDRIFGTDGLLPMHPTLQNYADGWRFFGDRSFGTFFLNSFVLCAIAVLGNVVSCSMAAYAFARLQFPGKRVLFAIMLGTIMLPIHAQLVPQYIAFLKFGWVDTILPMVVPKLLATDSFFIFLMVQFMRSLPRELEQAAQIDGAGFWQRYLLIVLPLARPALVTTAVFTFIAVYNDYFSQLIYLTSPQKLTVPLALRLFIDSGGGTSNYGGLFAMSVLSLVPVIGCFLASQRLLVQGFATSGFK